MIRVLLVLLASSTLLAAPIPKAKDTPTLYGPTKEGDKRVYEVKVVKAKGGKEEVTEYTDVVTKAESKDGVVHVSLGRVINGRPGLTEDLEVSGKGVFHRAVNGRNVDPPMPLLKLPSKPGDKWEYQPQPGQTTSFTVGTVEEVEVPAGKFKAIRVVSERSGNGVSLQQTHWYAPGVGLVKMSTTKPGLEIEITQVLKSFTPGK
jgi:hypothetical protein